MRNLLFRILIAALAFGGLWVSVLALRVHNMDPGAAPPCAVNDTWDCGAVNHSRFAVFPARDFDEAPDSKKLHIPVAIFGIVGYGLMALAALFGRWWILLQLAEVGFACACFLSYIEAYFIQKWCIYCVWSQSIVAAILVSTIVVLLYQWRERHVARGAAYMAP